MEKSWRTSAKTSISSRELVMRFSRSFSTISPWIPTILFLSWGTCFFDQHAQFHAPNRNRKKGRPLERQKIRFRDEVFASHGLGGCYHPIFLSCTSGTRCVWGLCEESISKDAVFVESGGLEGMRVPRSVLKKKELQDTDNADRSYYDRK